MFDGTESVNTEVFKCPRCQGEIYRLYDVTPVGAQAQMKLVFKCANMQCQHEQLRTVMPGLNDMTDPGPPLPIVPGRPENQLGCERIGVQARSRANTHGHCLVEFFRVLERGNELYSRCAKCGHGSSLGMINAALE